MKSLLTLPVVALVVLLSLDVPAKAGNLTIQVDGKLAGGNFVTATCVVGNNGQVAGTGVLYGQNAATGATYKYPFTVTKMSTAGGKLTLTGAINGGPAITLSASVPAGAMVFSYTVGANTSSLAGQGTVVVK
jgi:uncharacterized membrane protein